MRPKRCLVLFLSFLQQTFSAFGNFTGCHADCLKCGPKGCLKCPNFTVYPTRECVTSCPFGHKPKWSTLADYMGRICRHNGNVFGLGASATSILCGILAGFLVCTILVSTAIFYVKYKRKSANEPSESSSDIDDSPEKREFLKQLDTLRPYAQTYLDMLNDTRRQIREQRAEGDAGAISAYRPVLRDLAKVLLLLNRSLERIALPEDWEHLLSWAEKALKRYKRMSGSSQPQVAQLITFLQGPVLPAASDTEQEFSARGSATMSTFKPDQVFGSNVSLQDVAINKFNSNYDSKFPPINPQWKFEYSLVANSSAEFDPAAWKNSKEYLNNSLFLEDDFYQLGFRPQDEITTEL